MGSIRSSNSQVPKRQYNKIKIAAKPMVLLLSISTKDVTEQKTETERVSYSKPKIKCDLLQSRHYMREAYIVHIQLSFWFPLVGTYFEQDANLWLAMELCAIMV